MRFKSKIWQEGNDITGHWCRARKRFLLFPKTIGDEKRWLETAVWKDEHPLESYEYSSWDSVEWLPIDFDHQREEDIKKYNV